MKRQYYLYMMQVSLLLFSCLFFSCAKSLNPRSNKVKYSQEMVERRALKSFFSNRSEQQLAKAHWDYVPGLVAFSVLKAWEQYPQKEEYYKVVKAYADHCLQGKDTIAVGASNIDDLAAGKIFFTLYEREMKKGNKADAERYKNCVTFLRNKLKYQHSRIGSGKPGTGGFFHKAQYPNQMWLDGLYMGPAMYAGWQGTFGTQESREENYKSWSDIAMQFKILNERTYDKSKQLNYHAWSADPRDENSFWARKEGEYKGCSPEFWGRGMGWFFAALVDVLELMPKDHPDYQALVQITNQVAKGLARHQDKRSGNWYQLLQYDEHKRADDKGDLINGEVVNKCDNSNYLESSASSMFTYAYLKGIRLGALDRTEFMPVAEKAYNGLLTNFIREGVNGELDIIQSCASAGLGPAKDKSRTGTINYYLCGKDVTVTQNEGKAIGPFILASLEYERR
ncbi:glycoside hydrolase family 88/105 protein [Desertivirga brevis]|uniref:glycoside hydrolase family 88/105 protein n=1 Tax=Desertivirga brevis TaxID=2810310 RepID=UPI001A956A31|nr:glycoside hydrolase family 88 protein [Pedobacter sp. SYSU D00873]